MEAHDGDDAINAEITYTVESISPSCDECFEFAGATLQQTKDLTQEMILARLVTVVVKVINPCFYLSGNYYNAIQINPCLSSEMC